MSYCLLDAARMEEQLEQAKALAGEQNYQSLYKGEVEKQLSNVAPYLFATQPPNFLNWLFTEGWGHSWGVFILAKVDYNRVYNHVRRFLMVRADDGRNMYFRFYDPRVLRQFLLTCTTEQLTDFFGPIRYSEFGISYWLEGQTLKSQRMPRLEAENAYKSYLQSR